MTKTTKMTTRKLVIVGNATDLNDDISNFIDSCDVVIRISTNNRFMKGTGSKTTHYFLTEMDAHPKFSPTPFWRWDPRMFNVKPRPKMCVLRKPRDEGTGAIFPYGQQSDFEIRRQENIPGTKLWPTAGFELLKWVKQEPEFVDFDVYVANCSFLYASGHCAPLEHEVISKVAKFVGCQNKADAFDENKFPCGIVQELLKDFNVKR